MTLKNYFGRIKFLIDFDPGFGFLVVENGGTREKINENAKNNETQNRVTPGRNRTLNLPHRI